MATKKGMSPSVFEGTRNPFPERRLVRREEKSEINFWNSVEARIKGFIVYQCLEPFVKKEVEKYLGDFKNSEEHIANDDMMADIKKLGMVFFEEITEKIKAKLRSFGKDEEKIAEVNAETVAALFKILLEKEEKIKSGTEERRKERGGKVTILRKSPEIKDK